MRKGPARGWRGSGIDGEDRLGFTLMCIEVVVDISWYSKIYSYNSQGYLIWSLQQQC